MATIKQEKALDELVGNGGNITKAMLAAGYSPATANTPQKLTESKGWQELLSEYLPDLLLNERHREGLDAIKKSPRIIGRDNKGNPEYEYVSEPDYYARHKYLETAYKIKGRMEAKQPDINLNFVVRRTEDGIILENVSPTLETTQKTMGDTSGQPQIQSN